jgi:hypothetical protein
VVFKTTKNANGKILQQQTKTTIEEGKRSLIFAKNKKDIKDSLCRSQENSEFR